MNRPQTPAGPLFVRRGANPRVPLSDNAGSRRQDGRITARLPLGEVAGNVRRHGAQSIIYDLQKRTTTDSTSVRRPFGNIDRNVPRDYTFSHIADRLQQSREKDSENRTRRVLLPVVAGQQARVTSGKSVRLGSSKQPLIDAANPSKELPGSGIHFPPQVKPMTTAKKSVKFRVDEKAVPPAHSSGSSVKSDNRQNNVTTSCLVKGTSISHENKVPEHSQRRIVRRPPTSMVNSLSMYRQQLIAKQSQEAKYATDNTKLPPECVIRRSEAESSNLKATPSPQLSTRLIYRIPSQPPGLRQDMHLPQSDAVKTAPAQPVGSPETENIEEKRFSYKLAEKAEELFTKSLRHHESDKTPNVVNTYVVEDDPAALLAKLDNSPASLTTKNLEMHNSWWTSVENKEKICQQLNIREKRIRRWITEMESTSRLNHMRVVNIIVKDRGYPVRSPRDDALERQLQVPSQVMA